MLFTEFSISPSESYTEEARELVEFNILCLMNQLKDNNRAVVLDFDGKYDENIQLKFDEGISTFGACPVMFQNEFYLFGGTSKHSKMVSHNL